ncbi:MAG: riboflavin synthase [Bacteroidetes bacterium]|nr:riboflavin synthase [Bacteroidota bacterium]
MFTGIVEAIGTVVEVIPTGANLTFWIDAPISPDLKPDQSLAHDGACLTVEDVQGSRHRVTAVRETLDKTILGTWQPGHRVNLERSMMLGGRIDGHLVQGHVDTTGTCSQLIAADGSWEMTCIFPTQFSHLVIEKGSICINGVSLTAFSVEEDRLTVAIIPYTWTHTTLSSLRTGRPVNLEFDLLGKYVARLR